MKHRLAEKFNIKDALILEQYYLLNKEFDLNTLRENMEEKDFERVSLLTKPYRVFTSYQSVILNTVKPYSVF